MNFRIVRKGYDTKETDDYILKLTKEYEDELAKQKALILALKDKLISLSDKVKDMESKKQMVSSALMKAVEKAEETERIAKQKFDSEIAQLKSFHIRWTSYYKKLLEKYPLDDELKNAEEFTRKVNEIFLSPSQLDKEALEEFRKNHQQITGIKTPQSSVGGAPYMFASDGNLDADDIQSLLSEIDTDL